MRTNLRTTTIKPAIDTPKPTAPAQAKPPMSVIYELFFAPPRPDPVKDFVDGPMKEKGFLY
jgi:hypothetical protein